ncbi:MAG TPA: ABC transporter substrate-binding protein [Thermodesulfobacteriota bacterium]
MSDTATTRRQVLRAAAFGAAALGATPFIRSRALAQQDEIRIGALCELSGVASTIGSQQALGIQMAVDEINKTGGVLGKPGIGGRPVRLVLEDTESKVATGLSKAKKLVERDRVHVLTGVIFSSVSLAVQEYLNKEGKVPFINTGSGNPAISEPPACGTYSFALCPSSRLFSLPAAQAAKKYGAKWFFIGDDYSWGRNSVELMKDAANLGRKIEIVGEEYPPLGTTNYAPYVTKAIAAGPDVIGLVVFGAGYARIIKQIRQMGVRAHLHHNFWSQIDAVAAGESVLGMTAGECFTYEHPSAPRMQQFAQAYHALHGAWPDPTAARAYTGVEMLAMALQNGGTTDPVTVVRELRALRYRNSVMGDVYFRECDHAAVMPIFMVEGKQTEKYGIYPAYVEPAGDPDALLVPCGKTGCEPATKL